ncbi:MAG: hypothetical protein IJ043_07170 [Clostridia bacterium]|nr:hypothetical protein [Clostridia bacterium]
MKHIFKLSGALLMDQLIGVIAGFMWVLCITIANNMLFKNDLIGYALALIICFGLFAYITYNSAFKSGFHDSHRAIKDMEYKGYLYKGVFAGIISAVPLLILYMIYRTTGSGIVAVYFQLANMYWTWPMIKIFPNHLQLVMVLAFVPMVIIPWIGYIAGYKNFMVTDILLKCYKRYTEKE